MRKFVIVEKKGTRFLFEADDFRLAPGFAHLGFRVIGEAKVIGRNEITADGRRFHVYEDRTLREETA